MKRLAPSSLLGQVTLALALALLIAQAVSVTALYRASEKRRDASAVNAIALRLIAETAGRESEAARRLRAAERRRGRLSERERRERQLERIAHEGMPFAQPGAGASELEAVRRGGGIPMARLMRLSLQRSEEAPVAADVERITRYEEALGDVLREQDITTGEIRIVRRRAGEDPHIRRVIDETVRPPFPNWEKRVLLVAAIQGAQGPGWLTIRLPTKRDTGGLPLILLQTLVIFLVLVAALYLVLRRLTRPLAQLTARVGDFSKAPERAVRLEERGPSDTRLLIRAHNEMEARIAAMLDEKDVMLGAIGHDLKTPLAALRVRIESVPDEAQRARMADSIEDITRTLDDILSLTRVGRAVEDEREAVDITALADGMVEEFEDLGEPVTLMEAEDAAPRVVAAVQVTWLKRALRNLVSNAVRYGGAARVSVRQEAGRIALSVEDDGPGIAEDRIADMLEPFTRGEASRNRATGGAGLGLTLARAIAEAHGGSLTLVNRAQGGLKAEIRIPA